MFNQKYAATMVEYTERLGDEKMSAIRAASGYDSTSSTFFDPINLTIPSGEEAPRQPASKTVEEAWRDFLRKKS